MAGWWLAAAAASAQVAGGISAAREARIASRENIKLIEAEVAEKIRRMDREQVFRLGAAKAEIGAGGILNSGSAERVLANLEDEYSRQRAWEKRVGAQRANATRRAASGAGAGSIVQGMGSFAQAAFAPNPAAAPPGTAGGAGIDPRGWTNK